jgi:hypothetical protein
LASKRTAKFDVAGKKDIYERELKTTEYVVYNPHTQELQGWRMSEGCYVPMPPNSQGWLWCQELELWVGRSEYQFLKDRKAVTAPRFFNRDGQLVLTRDEAQAKQIEAQAKQIEAQTKQIEVQAKRTELAEAKAQVEAQARLVAEAKAQVEAQARLMAEAKAQAEAQARLVAEVEIARLKALLTKLE